ncbi:MAG: SAM-dependent methyltransferase [Myxococcota bacterium]
MPRPGYDRKDHFHQRAKQEGYRSRAAYKLLELCRGRRLLRRGDRVIDLGCWPGAWLQVAAEQVGKQGRVVGVDLAETEPLPNENVIALTGDLTQAPVVEALLEALQGRADVLLCDAAPKLTGIRDTDRAREEELLLGVEAALPRLLAPGGRLLLKIMEGPEAQAIDKRLRRSFRQARALKPRASRKGTTERYLFGEGYQPPDPAD